MSDRDVEPESGIVTVSESAVVYRFSFADRRDVASCPLVKSEPWVWLETEQQPFSQRDLIRALRITFDGWLPRDNNLVTLLRTVKWKIDGQTDVDIQRGKEALGRSITRQVYGLADFPEEFTLTGQVFVNVKFDSQVRVALDPLPDIEKFEVTPYPSQIEEAKTSTLENIRRQIHEETGVPTFISSDSSI